MASASHPLRAPLPPDEDPPAGPAGRIVMSPEDVAELDRRADEARKNERLGLCRDAFYIDESGKECITGLDDQDPG